VVRRLLESAVRSHLMSDVPLGVFLSGGLDSSALAAMVDASRAGADPDLRGPVFAEREANELDYARLVAKWVGARHREVVVRRRSTSTRSRISSGTKTSRSRFPPACRLYFVARLARDHVKVVLTARAPTSSFSATTATARHSGTRVSAARMGARPRRARRGVRQLSTPLPSSAAGTAGRSFMAFEPACAICSLENFAVFPESLQRRLLTGDAADRRDPYADAMRCYESAFGRHARSHEPGDLQTLSRRASDEAGPDEHGASIESRVPFLDDHVVDHVAALPGRLKLQRVGDQGGAANRGRRSHPAVDLARRKMGFPVPVGRWLRDEFRPVVDEFVLGGRAQGAGFLRPPGAAAASSTNTGPAGSARRSSLAPRQSRNRHRIFCEGEHPADVMRAVPGHRSRTFYANPVGSRWADCGRRTPAAASGAFKIISELSRRHRVTVVTTHGSGDDPDGLARRLPHCDRVVSIPYVVPSAAIGSFRWPSHDRGCPGIPVDL